MHFDNGFFSGGLLLMIVGGLLAYARAWPPKAWQWARVRVVSTLELDEKDPAFSWVRAWLSDHLKAKRMRNVRCLIRYESDSSASLPIDATGLPDAKAARARPIVTMVPGNGTFLVRFQGRRLLVRVIREDLKLDREFTIGQKERIYVSALGRSGEMLFPALLLEAYNRAIAWRSKRVTIYYPSYSSSWGVADERQPRPPESLVFDDGLFQTLIDDLHHFLTNRDWYVSMGIPWRRGVLLKGPPGNGKTSLVLALAGRLGCDVRVLNLSDVSDANLMGLLASVPAGDIVLLEDTDAAFVKREGNKDTLGGKLTFSGLLNAIDGIGSKEGRILFMTTNHPERLDPALTRPGRIDVQVDLPNASRQQAVRMFRRFFPDARPSYVETFADHVPDRGWSMATVQEVLLSAVGEPGRAIESAKETARRLRDARRKECNNGEVQGRREETVPAV